MERFKRPFGDEGRQEADAEAGLLDCTGSECHTSQSAAVDCDINVIVRRAGVTGELPQSQYPASYGDFSHLGSYHDALTALRVADERFLTLPARVRAAFGNDPGVLLQAMDAADSDPAMAAKLVAAGVMRPPPVAPPAAPAAAAPVVAPVAARVAV